METTIIEVVGNILQFVNTVSGPTTDIVQEFSFDTLEKCWEAAIAFNSVSKGTGYVMFCWPMPVEVLVQ